MENERYEGKPFLRLLELYVIWSIGELNKEQSSIVNRLTPKLRKIYSVDAEWYEIIASQMELPSDLPEKIKSVWEQNKHNVIARGIKVGPEMFARQLIDNNLI